MRILQNIFLDDLSMRLITQWLNYIVFSASVSLANVVVQKIHEDGISFHVPSIVFYTEFSKLVVTIISAFIFKNNDIFTLCQKSPTHILKLSIPAICYIIQNNLSMYAIIATNAPTFQLWSNIKILSTAAFMYIFLKLDLSLSKVLCLLQILCGLAITRKNISFEIGILYIILSSIVSGFSSTYTELLLKNSSTSFVANTFYMYCFTTLFAFPFYDFQNYQSVDNPYIKIVLFLNIIVGISVSLIMKYADNMVKIFLTIISLIITGLISNLCCSTKITSSFLLSSFTVCISIIQYNLEPTKKDESKSIQRNESSHLLGSGTASGTGSGIGTDNEQEEI